MKQTNRLKLAKDWSAGNRKLMWVVEVNADHAYKKHTDIIFMELWSLGKDGLRQFIIDGEGVLWFPSTEGKGSPAEPLGKLLVITEVGCNEETLKRAMALCNLRDKRVIYFPAND
jgi:hypothetical protein